MKSEKKYVSLGWRLYIFLTLTVITVAFGTAMIAYFISSGQIDRYYRRVSEDNSRYFASIVDADYLAELRTVAESDEFQQLHAQAEEEENEELISEYLEEKGLLEKFLDTRKMIMDYLEIMQDIKYLYTIVAVDKDALSDMYLVDDGDTPLLSLGYYEEREPEFYGKDLTKLDEPTVSHGDWGWLCSAYCPVIASDGSVVCVVGCDFGMDDVMNERYKFFTYIFIGAIIFTFIILAAAVHVIKSTVIRPLKALTSKTKEFRPEKNTGYKDAGVIDLELRNRDEISDIYDSIRAMQTDIIDYLNDLYIAETDLREKDEQIDAISRTAYHDSLTGVGSKAAYIKKTKELDGIIASGAAEFALAMIDINNLKLVNDSYGHKAGDTYILGCCRLACDVFKHSPVYRIGGDEFVAVMQGTDYENRYKLVEELKEKYRTTSGQTDKKPWHRYSAAVGLAERASDDNTFDLVFKRADKAMYDDKNRCKSEFNGFAPEK